MTLIKGVHDASPQMEDVPKKYIKAAKIYFYPILVNIKNSRVGNGYRERGICRRSKKAVHWLNTMLLEPDERRITNSFKRAATLDDSTQFFSTSI